jgi:P pilus assembly chaperone PapD
MTKHPLLLASILALCFAIPSKAGVSIGGTRFIYGEKTQGLKVELRNSSAETWLINTHVSTGGAWSGVSASPTVAPFIVTPPLFALKKNKEGSLRLIKTTGELPLDRESLFTLSIAAIPSGKTLDNRVQIAVRSQLKLFYRPSNLPGEPEKAYSQLRWAIAKGKTKVINPTPYYVTLVNVQANGKHIENAGMVAPFSVRVTDWCLSENTCQLHWRSLNDYGRLMPEQTVAAERQ